MTELERELRELGHALELPAAPDVSGRVGERLAVGERGRPVLGRRRSLVLALAALAAAATAVMAVPQARSAVLEWLGLRGVSIERVDTRPTVTRGIDEAELGLGEPVTLAEARGRVGFEIFVPRAGAFRDPDAVHVGPGERVSLVYRDERGKVEALITQFRAALDDQLVDKFLGPGTTAELVTVGGSRGWWIAGEPHEVVLLREGEPLVDTLRLAGNTLLWQRGELTLRIEGRLRKAEAIRVAESARPL